MTGVQTCALPIYPAPVEGVQKLQEDGVQNTTPRGANDDNMGCKTAHRHKEEPSEEPSVEPSVSPAVPEGALFAFAPDPKPEPKPSGWERIIAAINESYAAANKGVNTPFTPRFFQRLRQLITSADWKPEDWIACVQNRAQSDDANMADPPQNFVEQLMRYRGGPLDQYHLPKGRKKNGSQVSRIDSVNDTALADYRRRVEQDSETQDLGHGFSDRKSDANRDDR